jgi:tripartite-type tricarboxylate transporter receptor subunit TctC
MKNRSSAALLVVMILGAFASVGALAQAQPWPSKPVRIVVPVLPGAFTDLAARSLAAALTEQTGQQFLVENRTGAGATLGADYVAKSPPDGYTFLFTENGFTMAPALYPNLPYDALKDFVHITPVAEAPTVWVARVQSPPWTLKQWVDYARANPGKVTIGSGGQGTSSHLASEFFRWQEGLNMLHVPFKGVVAAYTEIVAGRLDLSVSSIASPMGHIKAGRAQALAVTGKERSPLLPDVPTFAEAGFPKYDMPIWFGFIGPAGIPEPVLTRFVQETARALEKPAVRDMFMAQGARPTTSTPAAFSKRVEAEMRQWRELISKAGIKLEQ